MSAALWWAYFDVTALITERALAAAEGVRQIRLARGGYSFLHLPMIIGVVMHDGAGFEESPGLCRR